MEVKTVIYELIYKTHCPNKNVGRFFEGVRVEAQTLIYELVYEAPAHGQVSVNLNT